MSELSGFSAGIFYTETQETLEGQLRKALSEYTNHASPVAQLPAALFVPHAAYDYILQPTAAAFQSVAHLHPDRVILLAPLHSVVLPEDAPSFLFFPASSGCKTPFGSLSFDRSTAEMLVSAVQDGWAAASDSYFEEEPSWELTAPFVHYLFPAATYFPMLYAGRSAKQATKLAGIISEMITGRTLLIISSNAAVWHERLQGSEQAYRLTSILSTPTGDKRPPLLDLARKKLITACGTSLFDALYRSRCLTQPWNIISEPFTAPETTKLRTISWFASGAVELSTSGGT
ncbi:MAG: AmmeMemoRadiSam system protein B [Spirochaetota bacterium]